MIAIVLKPRAKKFIQSLSPKHQRQIKDSILNLQMNPLPHDSRPLKGYAPCLRSDVGEYRIIYRYSKEESLITIVLVGNRNDQAVYRIAKRILAKQ